MEMVEDLRPGFNGAMDEFTIQLSLLLFTVKGLMVGKERVEKIAQEATSEAVRRQELDEVGRCVGHVSGEWGDSYTYREGGVNSATSTCKFPSARRNHVWKLNKGNNHEL